MRSASAGHPKRVGEGRARAAPEARGARRIVRERLHRVREVLGAGARGEQPGLAVVLEHARHRRVRDDRAARLHVVEQLDREASRDPAREHRHRGAEDERALLLEARRPHDAERRRRVALRLLRRHHHRERRQTACRRGQVGQLLIGVEVAGVEHEAPGVSPKRAQARAIASGDGAGAGSASRRDHGERSARVAPELLGRLRAEREHAVGARGEQRGRAAPPMRSSAGARAAGA